MMKTRWVGLAFGLMAATLYADPQIIGFSNGTLIGSNLTPNSTAAVEWAPTVAGPWSSTWDGPAAVAVGPQGTAAVPVAFFYRLRDNVVVTTTTSTSTTAVVRCPSANENRGPRASIRPPLAIMASPS